MSLKQFLVVFKNREICKRMYLQYYPLSLESFIDDHLRYKNNAIYSRIPFNNLICIVTEVIKRYTKIYKKIKNRDEIQENEKNILKLFVRISSL